MIERTIGAILLAVTLAASGAPVLAADDTNTPANAAPRPEADTKNPGQTATDAVTNPSAVPPSKGVDGVGVPPDNGSEAGKPAGGASPAR